MSPSTSLMASSTSASDSRRAGVGHGVQHRHGIFGVLAHGAMHEIGADEAGATGDQQPHGQTLAERRGQLGGVSPSGPASSLSAANSVLFVAAAQHLDRHVVGAGLQMLVEALARSASGVP